MLYDSSHTPSSPLSLEHSISPDQLGLHHNNSSPPTSPIAPPPQTLAPVLQPTILIAPPCRISMLNNTTEVFYGDGREGKNPQNFLCAFRREMRALATTDNKVITKAFVDYLGASSTADRWYEDLPQPTQESWKDIETEFAKRWPRVTQATRMEQELERELLMTALGEKELGEKVNSGGIEVWTHVAWADKMAALVGEAKLSTKTTHIWQVRDKLPEAIKEVVKSTHVNWTAFLQAVRNVELQHIRDAVEKGKKREKERLAVENRLRLLEAAQSSPTAGIRTQLSRTTLAPLQSPIPAP